MDLSFLAGDISFSVHLKRMGNVEVDAQTQGLQEKYQHHEIRIRGLAQEEAQYTLNLLGLWIAAGNHLSMGDEIMLQGDRHIVVGDEDTTLRLAWKLDPA